MKKLLCLCLLFSLVTCAVPCKSEVPAIRADDDDIVIMLEEALSEMEWSYSCVTLNSEKGIFVIDLALDGLTEYLLLLKKEGYDETFDQWVQVKGIMLSLYESILDMFKTIHREDLRLILNIVNDDAYIREDYSTISHNPLLSIGVFGSISIDEMADGFVFETPLPKETPEIKTESVYILNKNSWKFHIPSCDSVTKMKEKNKKEFKGDRQDLIDMGYTPCGICHP